MSVKSVSFSGCWGSHLGLLEGAIPAGQAQLVAGKLLLESRALPTCCCGEVSNLSWGCSTGLNHLSWNQSCGYCPCWGHTLSLVTAV